MPALSLLLAALPAHIIGWTPPLPPICRHVLRRKVKGIRWFQPALGSLCGLTSIRIRESTPPLSQLLPRMLLRGTVASTTRQL
jgi:hypothetical protein